MPIYARKNLYQGVNAHLHSSLQAQGGWSSFHTSFIGALARSLDALLPEGYWVDIEQSLQIREIHPDTGERLRRPEPDLTIYRTREEPTAHPTAAAVATVVQRIPETFDLTEDLYYSAVVIYRMDVTRGEGRAVTRLELLSPTNKQGEGMIQYREKRYAALKSGTALVEIDLLHETATVISGLPRYPEHADSYPYTITVSDPTPDFESGAARTYAMHVDTAFPLVAIPLGSGRALEFDFNPLYDEVYSSLSAYGRRVDYAALPLNFERYSAEDRARVRRRMEEIARLYPAEPPES